MAGFNHGVPLSKVRHVRNLISKTVRDVQAAHVSGDLEAARIVIYGCKVLADIITKSEIEKRLDALEATPPNPNEQKSAVQ